MEIKRARVSEEIVVIMLILFVMIIMRVFKVEFLFKGLWGRASCREDSYLLVFSSSDKFSIFVSKSGNFSVMSLKGSLKLVVRIPNVY
jgi:hypothetical protein